MYFTGQLEDEEFAVLVNESNFVRHKDGTYRTQISTIEIMRLTQVFRRWFVSMMEQIDGLNGSAIWVLEELGEHFGGFSNCLQQFMTPFGGNEGQWSALVSVKADKNENVVIEFAGGWRRNVGSQTGNTVLLIANFCLGSGEGEWILGSMD